jgi:hypothetical protein
MKSVIPVKRVTRSHLVTLALVCFGLLPELQAVVPAPDGGYPGGNTAEGQAALLSLTTGGFNTAIGFLSLRSDTMGQLNTAVGAGALLANTADNNTATGAAALLLNSTGTGNTANGASALLHNDTGSFNTAVGNLALLSNTTGDFNSGFGQGALASNTIGANNTASGAGALFNNTQGGGNTAIGFQALNFNNVGNGNTAIGFQALEHNTTGFNNIAVGAFAGLAITAGDLNIDIGNLGFAGESDTIRIGDINQARTFIAGISGVAVSGNTVVVNGDGQLGVAGSSARFKNDIKPMDKASEAILALKPVTFHYKKEIDPAGISQFGLVAEEVEKVNPDLVVRDKEGKPYSVRYDQVNAMLLNEFLKEHSKNEEQEATIAQLKKEMETVVARLKEDESKIQKVTDQFEMSRHWQQVVQTP